MNKVLFLVGIMLVFFAQSVSAASADGTGPWADLVVSYSQGLMKNGMSVPSVRSNPQAAVGESENDYTNDSTFFSLGFGGSIILKFDNPISSGVMVVESTYPDYPLEKASVDISSDGSSWVHAGSVSQDGEVNVPEEVNCASYVRITDISHASDFPDDIADGYDVDGVKATGEFGNCAQEEPTPTPFVTPTPLVTGEPTPTQLPEVTPTAGPTATPQPAIGGWSEGSSGTSQAHAPVCTEEKPSSPIITSVVRTSGTTALIRWTSVPGADHYILSYGVKPDVYVYGVPDTGNTTSFQVGGLDPREQYYFVVRAAHGCMPSDASGYVNTSFIGGSDVLGIATSVLGQTGSFITRLQIVLGAVAGFVGVGMYYAFSKKQSR